MAVVYTGGTSNQTELEQIQEELYAESHTIREGLIDIQQGHKSGADVYESSVVVVATAATTGAVTATGDIDLNANKTGVALVSYQFEDTIDQNALKGTRFERSMQAGAFNIVSSEFDQKVLIQAAPAIGEVVENMIWNGATTAHKVLIAALTPGAGQGSISAGAQTLAAAMPVNLVSSIPAVILENNSQAKATPGAGVGDYIKVLSIVTPTAANIAAEYGKMYAIAPSKTINHRAEPSEIFAPLNDRQLIKQANNAVGAAQQVNFLVEGSGENEVISYNGHKINFVPLVGFRILAIPSYLKWLMDLTSDVSTLNMGQMADGSMQRYIKNIQTAAAWVVGQKYVVLYGG
tara:strand:+ start:387 stop:1430 length:1044 start_codon:yes stop_codon:yes gene_type:complete